MNKLKVFIGIAISIAVLFILAMIYAYVILLPRVVDVGKRIEHIADSLEKNRPLRDSLKKIYEANISVKDQKKVYVDDVYMLRRHNGGLELVNWYKKSI